MGFTFKIFRKKNGRLELFFEPFPLALPSTNTALRLAKHFASYVPVHLITIEAEDGSISELWFGDSQDIALAADQSRSRAIWAVRERGALGLAQRSIDAPPLRSEKLHR